MVVALFRRTKLWLNEASVVRHKFETAWIAFDKISQLKAQNSLTEESLVKVRRKWKLKTLPSIRELKIK